MTSLINCLCKNVYNKKSKNKRSDTKEYDNRRSDTKEYDNRRSDTKEYDNRRSDDRRSDDRRSDDRRSNKIELDEREYVKKYYNYININTYIETKRSLPLDGWIFSCFDCGFPTAHNIYLKNFQIYICKGCYNKLILNQNYKNEFIIECNNILHNHTLIDNI